MALHDPARALGGRNPRESKINACILWKNAGRIYVGNTSDLHRTLPGKSPELMYRAVHFAGIINHFPDQHAKRAKVLRTACPPIVHMDVRQTSGFSGLPLAVFSALQRFDSSLDHNSLPLPNGRTRFVMLNVSS
ncbi:hypothetical protein ACJ5NV_15565 [Loktanella agnita]